MGKERWILGGMIVVLVLLALKPHMLPSSLNDPMEPIRQLSKRRVGELSERYSPSVSMSSMEYSIPLSRYDKLIQRDPFAPEGQPIVETMKGTKAEPRRQTRWIFRGTAQVGPRRVAVLEETISKQVYFRGVGDEVEGYVVSDVWESGALLERDGAIITVDRPANAS